MRLTPSGKSRAPRWFCEKGPDNALSLIDALRNSVPDALEELAQLGRTLHRRRAADVLAYFDYHASNGPTEAINGRLEALRRNALGFRFWHPGSRAIAPTGAIREITA